MSVRTVRSDLFDGEAVSIRWMDLWREMVEWIYMHSVINLVVCKALAVSK